jgi:two-component system nitrogen regulation response regulator NtrX
MSAGHSILIVDDDESIRASLAEVLLDEGYRVATAADGIEALDYLRHTPEAPCLILLDLWMPRLNGQGFREQQLANRDWLSIPVVVISAAADAAERALALHACELLRKPIRLQELLQTVARNCESTERG